MTIPWEPMIVLWADFNEVFDENLIWTSLRRTPFLERSPLGEDTWIVLADDDGSSCWAVIRERSGPIVTCEIDWETWRPAPRLDVEQLLPVDTGDWGRVEVSSGFVTA